MKLVEFVNEKKATKPVVLEVKRLTNFCDYFVICSADNTMHVRAIYDWVLHCCHQEAISVHHYEADQESRWMLIDFFDVVLHVFLDETRAYYNLEYLWSEAKRVRPSRKKTSTK